MREDGRRWARIAAVFLAYGVTAALLWAPVAVERSVEATRFADRLGSVPVEVSLTHNGHSTLETGVLGSLYWEQTGAAGFGARVRVTGTPQAGGTLASYVSPAFVRANAAFISDPEEVARTYGAELRDRFVHSLLMRELFAFLLGGLVLTGLFRARSPLPVGWSRRTSIGVGVVVVATVGAISCGSAFWLFDRWSGNGEIEEAHPMPGMDKLSFSSPQTLELARQVEPFLNKNSKRNQERSRSYRAQAQTTLGTELTAHADQLAPRDGEVIVVAEADPQGSHVGTRVRADLYTQLVDALGGDAFAMRTISGDVTSNGTVAEAEFVAAEIAASGDIPTVVVKGDHDTDTTVEQLDDDGATLPDFDLTEVDDLDVVSGNDPAFKTLFGGVIVNETGVSEREMGEKLRDYVDEEGPDASIVLLHQPRSAAGYLGLDSLSELPETTGSALTTPYDDGIPDLPPGIINIGHLHDAAPPRIIWNTDGDKVTWTVLNQLGTAGGVEERPTYNRFSTPDSVPLKTLSVQLQYVDRDSGLQTGTVSIDLATDGTATISDRTDIGLP
ncbi:MAG: hypothetical protein L0H31_00640 [Nocardioidaceae bacterium]|nr:hypothetical protein [Nocardioidaceae bacterium]